MAEGQRELLDRLKINRDEEEDESGGNRWLIVGFMAACALVAVGAIYFFWPKSEEQLAAAEPPPATTGTAATAPTIGSGGVLSASGYVTARRLATVSAEITGRIAEVLIEEGMSVKADQVLARLDTTLAKTEVGIAEGNLRSARGALDAAVADNAEAQRALVRVQGVKAREFASTADLTRAQAAADSAAARLVQAQGNLRSAEQNSARAKALLDKHEIRAPFAGMVTTKDAQPGEIVSPSAAGGGFTRTGVCTIVDMNSLEVEVEVNEAFISRVKPNQRASATLDAYPEWEIPARVAAIIPTANRDKATVKVRVAIETGDPRILPEMAAKVLFFDDEKKAAAPSPTATATPPQGTPPQ
ncbi:MAG: efflux RND transporter periplasmic adaptor subunit [Alphaproteobacteria bacterium]|nr:efflux RND transporter periplasmic adaptor subunit [Alphaproteobacteria bacterium]